MMLQILELLPDLVLYVLLGLWIAHIVGMWANLFKRDE
jgi:hypothetical protein